MRSRGFQMTHTRTIGRCLKAPFPPLRNLHRSECSSHTLSAPLTNWPVCQELQIEDLPRRGLGNPYLGFSEKKNVIKRCGNAEENSRSKIVFFRMRKKPSVCLNYIGSGRTKLKNELIYARSPDLLTGTTWGT